MPLYLPRVQLFNPGAGDLALGICNKSNLIEGNLASKITLVRNECFLTIGFSCINHFGRLGGRSCNP